MTPIRRKLIIGWVLNIAFLALLLAGHIQPAIYFGLIAFGVRTFMPPPIPDPTRWLALANNVWLGLLFGIALVGILPIPAVQRIIDQLFLVWCSLLILGFGLIIYNDVQSWFWPNCNDKTLTDAPYPTHASRAMPYAPPFSSSAARDRLIKRIGDINNFELPRPIVTLEEFFEGNDDWESIGYNLPDQPAPQEFFAFFKSIRDREEVADVLVEVKDLEDPDGWPATDTIWVVTYLSLDSLSKLLPERFRPDEWRHYPPGYPVEEFKISAGMEAFAIWYD